jgi:hypothetical protein
MPDATANNTPPPSSRPVLALVLCWSCDAVAAQASPPGWQVDDPPDGRRRPFYRLGTCPDCLETPGSPGGCGP